MNIFEYEGARPQVHPEAWIAPTATLIGDVRVAAGASIWYGAVLRADVGPIIVGEGSNVQDNSVLHPRSGSRVVIGAGSTIAHSCMIHGDRVGDGSLVGNSVTMLDASTVGSGCLVAAGSLLPPGFEVPDGSLALGTPAKVRGPVEPDSTAAAILGRNAPAYRELMDRHRRTVRRVG